MGLIPYGISFHVGSQQRKIDLWDSALQETKAIFDVLATEHNIRLKMLNLGGGLPAQYVQETEAFDNYSKQINAALEIFKSYHLEQIILEPGRSLVGNAGILVSEIVLISQRPQSGTKRWVYTDVGVFNGLIETLGESIQYPIMCKKLETVMTSYWQVQHVTVWISCIRTKNMNSHYLSKLAIICTGCRRVHIPQVIARLSLTVFHHCNIML